MRKISNKRSHWLRAKVKVVLISNKCSHWLRAKVKVVSGRMLGKMRGRTRGPRKKDAVRGSCARNKHKNDGNCGLKSAQDTKSVEIPMLGAEKCQHATRISEKMRTQGPRKKDAVRGVLCEE